MNILCVDQFSDLGGGQRSLLDLLPAFLARGWQPCLAVPSEGPLCDRVQRLGCSTNLLRCHQYRNGYKPASQILIYFTDFARLSQQVSELLRVHRIHLVYVNGARLLPPAAWAARRAGVPLVFHCHSRLLQRSALVAAGNALRLAHGEMIACCSYVAEPFKAYATSYRVIYNGVALGPYYRSKIASSPRQIGVIGRIEEEKGQLEFVRAAKIVLQHFPDSRFSIVGAPLFSAGDYYHRVVAASRGLTVAFEGWQDDIGRVLSHLELLVVPSTGCEATTRVIPEAYAAGVPVVAYPSGGIPEIVKDGETGFLVREITVAALAERIMDVMRLPLSEIRKVVQRAKRLWEQAFTLERYQQQVCRVLEEAAARGAVWRPALASGVQQRKQLPELQYEPINKAAADSD
ncbi:MAG TPA: glycosyltransferase family 4 protein [Alloacidobacterium sp.]|nr:glycosyltransferase family 4 protein [Alloacidobacterium sp.]